MRLSCNSSTLALVATLLTLAVDVQAAGAATRTIPRTVPTWADLADEDIRGFWQSVIVLEDGGVAVAKTLTEVTNSYPWAVSSDYNKLARTDASGTGKWVRQLNGPVNALWTGGDPADGARASDNTAFAAAESIASSLGVPVYLPAGTWDISNYTPTHSVEIVGCGDSTVIDADGTSTYDAFNLADYNFRASKVRITGCKWCLDAAYSESTSPVSTIRDVSFDDVLFDDFDIAINSTGSTEIDLDSWVDTFRVNRCRFNGSRADAMAINWSGLRTHRVEISGNEVYSVRHGFYLVTANMPGGYEAHEIHDGGSIVDNYIHDLSVGTQHYCNAMSVSVNHMDISRNRIEDVPVHDSGTTISHGMYLFSPDTSICDNVFVNVGNCAIYSKGLGARMLVIGNKVTGTLGVSSGSIGEAITLLASNAIVSGNYIDITASYTGSRGLQVSGLSYAIENYLCEANIIKGVLQYGIWVDTATGSGMCIRRNIVSLADDPGAASEISLNLYITDVMGVELDGNVFDFNGGAGWHVSRSGAGTLTLNAHDNMFPDGTGGIYNSAGTIDGRIERNNFTGCGWDIRLDATVSSSMVVLNNVGVSSSYMRPVNYTYGSGDPNALAAKAGSLNQDYTLGRLFVKGSGTTTNDWRLVSAPALNSAVLSGSSWLTPGTSLPVQVVTSAASTPKFLLSATNAVTGTTWRVVNQDGSNTLDVDNTDGGTLIKTVGTSSWAEFMWTGSTYVLVGYGGL